MFEIEKELLKKLCQKSTIWQSLQKEKDAVLNFIKNKRAINEKYYQKILGTADHYNRHDSWFARTVLFSQSQNQTET